MSGKEDLFRPEADHASDDDSIFHEAPPSYDSICSELPLESASFVDRKSSLTSVKGKKLSAPYQDDFILNTTQTMAGLVSI
jgi:hypothetical protein